MNVKCFLHSNLRQCLLTADLAAHGRRQIGLDVWAVIVTIGSHPQACHEDAAAKLFTSGRSQAVRLPKSLRFEGAEVIARRFGNGVLLLPMDNPWRVMRKAVEEFEPGFVLEREQPAHQEREPWL